MNKTILNLFSKALSYLLGAVFLSLGTLPAVCAEDTPYDRGMAHVRNHDYNLALVAFEEGVAKGDAACMYGMGTMYRNGLGRTKSKWIAYGYMRQAAELGHDGACLALGDFYFSGVGGPPDLVLARQWWEKGAERGDGASASNLGELYYLGDGVPQNLELARKFWSRSKELGFDDATVALAMLQTADPSAPSVDVEPLKALAAKEHPVAAGTLKYLELTKAGAPTLVKDSAFIHQAAKLCGVACTTMLLRQQGVKKSHFDVAQSRTDNEWDKGTPWDDLVKIAGKFGQNWRIDSYPYTDEGFAAGKAAMLAQLESGTPVMIDILQDETVKSAHTILVIGYDARSGEFLARNPARHFPGFQVFGEDQLKTVWRSIGFIRGNTNLLRPTLSVDHNNKSGRLRE